MGIKRKQIIQSSNLVLRNDVKIYNNPVKRKLKANDICIGSWIAMDHPWVADIMGQCDFEFLVVELEHSTIDLGALSALFATIELHGVVPLVRLSWNDPIQAKRVLEAGAYGLIVPMVNSKDEAITAVEMTKYPPLGKRSFGLGRAQDFGFNSQRYFSKANEETIVIVQIESVQGVENIESILDVEGIDGIFIGPYDLSGSMGIPGQLNHPRVVEGRNKVLQMALKKKIVPGIHIVHPDGNDLQTAINEGFRFIAYGGDILFLGEACQKAAADINKFLKPSIQ
jgi:2-keto-3-deoxy-L-rhamnonate aldolase RhmA